MASTTASTPLGRTSMSHRYGGEVEPSARRLRTCRRRMARKPPSRATISSERTCMPEMPETLALAMRVHSTCYGFVEMKGLAALLLLLVPAVAHGVAAPAPSGDEGRAAYERGRRLYELGNDMGGARAALDDAV